MAMVRLPTSLDNTSDRTALSCPVPCLDVHLPSFHPAKFSPPLRIAYWGAEEDVYVFWTILFSRLKTGYRLGYVPIMFR